MYIWINRELVTRARQHKTTYDHLHSDPLTITESSELEVHKDKVWHRESKGKRQREMSNKNRTKQ